MRFVRLLPKSVKNVVKKYLIPTEINKMPMAMRRERLIKFYEDKTGKKIDLDNPTLFTEKIQWMKLYYKNPDMSRCVDKIEFKKFIRERLGEGYTAELIDIWNSPREVDLKKLPEKFVIKSNCQSDGKDIYIVKNKAHLDIEAVEKDIKEHWFDAKRTLCNSFCRAYYEVKPKVLIEEYIEEFDGKVNDYKLFCFQGVPKFFYVAEDHFKNGENVDDYPITFFDLNWNAMDVKYGKHERNVKVKKPKHLVEMIDNAKKLSKGFPFVRVDFFDTEEQLYLAELTFYPGGGMTPYYPEAFDREMGEWLGIP